MARRLGILTLAAAVCGSGGGALAQSLYEPPSAEVKSPIPVDRDPAPPATPAVAEDGPSYPFSRLILAYGEGYPQPIAVEKLIESGFVELALDGDNLVVPREGREATRIPLSELTSQTRDWAPRRQISAGAINILCRSLVAEMNRLGVIGVQVTPDAAQIDLQTLADLRDPKADTALRILLLPAWVQTVEALTLPEENIGGEAAPSLVHRWMADESPLQPSTEEGAPGDAIDRDVLEDYTRRLSRHPGRRVDATMSPSGSSGGVDLEYLVTESKPWFLYSQISNTGTDQTGDLRERFGFVHNQFTGNDDILALDFITADFEDTYAFLGSYEGKLFGNDKLRWRVFGSWQQYIAADLGFGDLQYKGDGWTAGGELIGNIYQRRDLFIDLVGGMRYEYQSVDNEIAGTNSDAPFVFQYVGADLERYTPTATTLASLRLEWTLSGLTDVSQEELDGLGRIDTSKDWAVLKFDISQSFYLEPLIYGDAWADPDKPVPHTLAHEIALSARGQYAFGSRLTPTSESIVGGLYTVRGYPEALTAGDSTIVGSAEYRLHIPRLMGIESDPASTPLFGQPFRFRADRVYGYPDWDLVLKGFIDAGRAVNSDRKSFEHNETLVGAGVGMDILFKRFVSVRLDWGWALRDVPGEVSAGDNKFNFVVTIQY